MTCNTPGFSRFITNRKQLEEFRVLHCLSAVIQLSPPVLLTKDTLCANIGQLQFSTRHSLDSLYRQETNDVNDIRRDISGPVISVILWAKYCRVAPSRPEDGAGGVVQCRVEPPL